MSAAIAAPRVEQKPCGANKRAFVCPYHGWSYDLTGRLVGITDGATFGDDRQAARTACGRLKVAEKYGLVWVGADGAGGQRGRRASTSIAYLGAAEGRPVGLGHAGLGAAYFRADPAAHELEAGDRHLPRALSLPLPASRHACPRCSSTTSPTYERMGRHMRFAAAKRTLTELEGAAARRTGASRPRRSCSTRSSPTRC